MNMTEISKITKWMETTDLEEITFRDGGDKLSLKQSNNIPQTGFKIQSGMLSVSSPFVGVFRKSEKGKELSLKEGDAVSKNQVLGYVEVLKELKEIKSPCDGILKIISIEENKAVEYSQPLFFVEEK